jgi:hypothetical protein
MGRRQFETVVASALRQQLKSDNVIYRETVGVDESEVIDIYAPSGVIASLESLYVNIERPVEATAGEHVLFLSNILGASYMANRMPYSSYIGFNSFEWLNTSQAVVVTPKDNIILAVKGAKFTDDFPVRFNYQNYTDAQSDFRRDFTDVSFTQGTLSETDGSLVTNTSGSYIRSGFIPARSETNMDFFTPNTFPGDSSYLYAYQYDSLGNFLSRKGVGYLVKNGVISTTFDEVTKQVKFVIYEDSGGLDGSEMAGGYYHNNPHRNYRFVWLEVDSPN